MEEIIVRLRAEAACWFNDKAMADLEQLISAYYALKQDLDDIDPRPDLG